MTDVTLAFEAGRLAERQGWTSAELTDPDSLASLVPGAGQVIVLAPEGTLSVQHARDVAALSASGKSVAVVTADELTEEVLAWLPEACCYVVESAGEGGLASTAPSGESVRTQLVQEVLRGLAGDPDPETRRLVASHADVPKDVQTLLARDPEAFVQYALARNSHTFGGALALMADEGGSAVRAAVAQNPNLPTEDAQELIRRIAEDCRRCIQGDPDDDEAWEALSDIAINPRCPEDLLRSLAADPSYESCWHAIGRNSATPQDLLLQLARKGEDAEILRSPHVPPEVPRILSRDTRSSVRARAARSPSAPEEVLRLLAADTDSYVRSEAAHNPKTPEDALSTLAFDSDSQVRWCLADNVGVPTGLLELLSRDANLAVRNRVASNPNTPLQVLKQLASDQDHGVRQAVALNPQVPSSIFSQLAPLAAKASDWPTRREVARNPAAPAHVLLELSMDPESDVVAGVGQNPSAPESLLRRLSRATEPWVRRGIAENSSTPAAVLSELARDPYADVRSAVASNPNVHADLLELLARDSSGNVRWSVALNSATPLEVLEAMVDVGR